MKALEPDEKLVWCWLLNNTQHTQIPGVFRCWSPMVADETGLSLRRTKRCLDRLTAVGMLKHDPKTGLTWLPNALKRRTVRSPDNVRAWKRDFGALPECQLKHEIAQTFARSFSGRTENFAEVLRDVFGLAGVTQTNLTTSDPPRVDLPPTTNANKGGTEDQDQEEDKERDQEGGGLGEIPAKGKTPFQREVLALLVANHDLQTDRPAPDWFRSAHAIESLATTKSSPKRVRLVLPFVLERLGIMRASSPREGGPKGGMGFVLQKLDALVRPGAFEAEQRKFAPAEREEEADENDEFADFPRTVRLGP